MQVNKTVTAFILLNLWFGSMAEPQTTDFLYEKYALDGIPVAICNSSKEDEVWVVTDAASLVKVRWKEGIQKILPLRRGVKGAFPNPLGGVLIWFGTNEVQMYNSSGYLVLHIKVGPGAIRLARGTMGGYTVVEKAGHAVILYSLTGNKLLEWQREGETVLPLQISEEGLILDAQSTGSCVIRRIDGAVLNKLQFPHPLRIVSWVRGNLLLGVSPEGKTTLLSQEGKEIGSRSIFNKDILPAFSFIQIDEGGNVSSIDPEGILHFIPSEERLGSPNRSFPLDLKRSQVTALGFYIIGFSLWAGDSQWILHWIRANTLTPSNPTSVLMSDSLRLPKASKSPQQTPGPAEQYFLDLAQSPFLQKNLQLIEEAKESLRWGTLQWILWSLKRGLRVLVTREELGSSIRVEAVLLLGRIGDRFDGEWLGKRLIQEKDQPVRRSILESLSLLAAAPASSARKDLFTYLKNRRNHLELIDLRLSLTLLERWIKVSGIPLQPEELEQLSSLAALSPQFQKTILEFIRR